MAMDDISWMKEAMKEAARAGWDAHPNPMVGAVIVRDGEELGRGYHRGAGQPHAEVEALRDAASRGFEDVRGATVYVTLEPCNHYGRTPPCTEALIRAGVSRCVVGTIDSDPRVCGSGIRRLEAAGIRCEVGLCARALTALNAAFFTRTRFGRPYVTAKWAMTSDGKIATASGSSRWVTGPEARAHVHAQRARHDGIMVGTGTVLADDPQLNVRLDGARRQPVRVILDRRLRIPATARVFERTEVQRTVLFTSGASYEARSEHVKALEGLGVSVECVGVTSSGLELREVLGRLVEGYQMTTLYCEGGATLLGALHDMGVIDACHVYVAPKIAGGMGALTCMGGEGVEAMSEATSYRFEDVLRLGEDVCLMGRVNRLVED